MVSVMLANARRKVVGGYGVVEEWQRWAGRGWMTNIGANEGSKHAST
jgi:hypothetical protein